MRGKFGREAPNQGKSLPTEDTPPNAERASAAEERETVDTAADADGSRRDGCHSQTRREPTTGQLLFGFLTELSLIALAIWAALNFVVCVRIHYGNNMFPAVRDGDLAVTLRPQRPFVNAVVFYEHEGKLRLGRVIGMSGHVIAISEEGALTVNGFAPAEEIFYPTFPAENAEIAYPYTVPEGQVFILNDFRSDADDSRTFGGVDLKDVKGSMLLTVRRRGF